MNTLMSATDIKLNKLQTNTHTYIHMYKYTKYTHRVQTTKLGN